MIKPCLTARILLSVTLARSCRNSRWVKVGLDLVLRRGEIRRTQGFTLKASFAYSLQIQHATTTCHSASVCVHYPAAPRPHPAPAPWFAGVVLASANLLAGHFSDWTVQLGLGNIGCFLGGAVACSLSMAALLLFSTFGHLGKDELLPSKPQKA